MYYGLEINGKRVKYYPDDGTLVIYYNMFDYKNVTVEKNLSSDEAESRAKSIMD